MVVLQRTLYHRPGRRDDPGRGNPRISKLWLLVLVSFFILFNTFVSTFYLNSLTGYTAAAVRKLTIFGNFFNDDKFRVSTVPLLYNSHDVFIYFVNYLTLFFLIVLLCLQLNIQVDTQKQKNSSYKNSLKKLLKNNSNGEWIMIGFLLYRFT